MAKVPDPKQVKSAKRVLQVFEYFGASRQQATVMEIAREFGYPQSSTSELLGCLVELGFLRRDRHTRMYRPSARVAALGSWVHPRLFRHGGLPAMMDTLADETAATVVLGGMVGLELHHFHVVGAPIQQVHGAEAGLLSKGPMGRLLLSTCDRPHIRKLVHHMNAEAVGADDRVNAELVLKDVDQVRRRGFISSAGLDEGQGGIACVLLPQTAADEPLALGLIVAAGDTRGTDYYVRALRNSIAANLGLVLAHQSVEVAQPAGLMRRHN